MKNVVRIDERGDKDTESVDILEGEEEADEEWVVELHQHFLLPHHVLCLSLTHDVLLLQHLDCKQGDIGFDF